ncbi:MAG: hypothetical protein IT239_03215 [Bacteroidia bacterium]|nr:hypothetical protein [Bacteroidia bacterium]
MSKQETLYNNWYAAGARRLDLAATPNPLPQTTESIIKVKNSFRLLSETLAFLHKMYKESCSNMTDRHFAFLGNELIREWPDKDIAFYSLKAQEEIRRNPSAKLHKEHYTPISFFRDVFYKEGFLSKEDFYLLLANYYRIVFITEQENKALEKAGYRACRPLNAYDKIGITIANKSFWNQLTEELLK